MTGFSFTVPERTIFGRDSREKAATEVARLGRRVFLVRGRSVPWVDALASTLVSGGTAVESCFSQGEPDIDDVRDGVTHAREFGADCVLAVGGGATIDLGKAIAGLCPSEGDPSEYFDLGTSVPRRLSCPLPFVAMPTTAGTGAEATRNAVIGIPDRQLKISLRDQRLVPGLAIIDPALTDGLPKALTLATGLDAITQLIESYLCNRSNPVTDALCRGTIPPAISALRDLMKQDTPEARDTMARASYLSGLALANSGLGIVHGLASVIGARGGAHGAICGRLLADSLKVNRQAAVSLGYPTIRFEEVDAWLAQGFDAGCEDGASALKAFVDKQGLPTLHDLNLPESDFENTARQALDASSTKANAVGLDMQQVTSILQTAS